MWEYAGSSINTDEYVLAYKSTSGSKIDVELWTKIATDYRFRHFEVLSEHDRVEFNDRVTLHDAASAGQADAPTAGYTQIESILGEIKNTAAGGGSGGSGGTPVKYTLSKEGTNIVLTGDDGSRSTAADSDTTYQPATQDTPGLIDVNAKAY